MLTVQPCNIQCEGQPGRPLLYILPEMLEELLAIGFTQEKIAKHHGMSLWTIGRRIQEYNTQPPCEFSKLSDEEIDDVTKDYKNRHGNTTGQVLIMCYLRMFLFVKQWWVLEEKAEQVSLPGHQRIIN